MLNAVPFRTDPIYDPIYASGLTMRADESGEGED